MRCRSVSASCASPRRLWCEVHFDLGSSAELGSQMLYTFDLHRHPFKVVPSQELGDFRHRFGGPIDLQSLSTSASIARVLTLDLNDPPLAFLRFPRPGELPLLMDFASGAIDYSATPDGDVRLHRELGDGESLLDEAWPVCAARLEPIPYDQYRAGLFASAVVDHDFLSPRDRRALEALGESFCQLAGRSLQGPGHQPYCTNPDCLGFSTQVMAHLATVSQQPTPRLSMDFLPYDPAISYAFCQTCHSISASVIAD